MTIEDDCDPEDMSNLVVFIDPNEIEVDSERRKVDDANVAELMESMNRVGQIQPVVVAQKEVNGKSHLNLVAGGHRLEAGLRLTKLRARCCHNTIRCWPNLWKSMKT
jgi:uncharacterized ParB-like nuclease family protein